MMKKNNTQFQKAQCPKYALTSLYFLSLKFRFPVTNLIVGGESPVNRSSVVLQVFGPCECCIPDLSPVGIHNPLSGYPKNARNSTRLGNLPDGTPQNVFEVLNDIP